jgi:ELWxxDGT repeat protein
VEFDLSQVLRNGRSLDDLVDSVQLSLQYTATNTAFPTSFNLAHRVAVGSVLYTAASDSAGERLWRTDGTVAGTQPIIAATIATNGFFSPRSLVWDNGSLSFLAKTAPGDTAWQAYRLTFSTNPAVGTAVQLSTGAAAGLGQFDEIVALTTGVGAAATTRIAFTRSAGSTAEIWTVDSPSGTPTKLPYRLTQSEFVTTTARTAAVDQPNLRLTAVNGVATTAMRSDASPALPVISSTITSIFPWSAVMKSLPPSSRTFCTMRRTPRSMVSQAWMPASTTPVWPTMSGLA